jgi:hypothetical protein
MPSSAWTELAHAPPSRLIRLDEHLKLPAQVESA